MNLPSLKYLAAAFLLAGGFLLSAAPTNPAPKPDADVPPAYADIFDKAEVFDRAGKRVQAIDLLEKAVEKSKKEFGQKSALYINALERLCDLYVKYSMFLEAQDYMEYLVAFLEAGGDKGQPQAVYDYYLYGAVLYGIGEEETAETYLLKTVDLSGKRLALIETPYPKASRPLIVARLRADELLIKMYTDQDREKEAAEIRAAHQQFLKQVADNS